MSPRLVPFVWSAIGAALAVIDFERGKAPAAYETQAGAAVAGAGAGILIGSAIVAVSREMIRRSIDQ